MKIQSTRVYINEKFQPATITINQGKIEKIELGLSSDVDYDYKNLRISPGFVDIHCHGYMQYDSNFATEEGLKRWINDLPKDGVTSFLATTSTAPEAHLLKSYKLISEVIATQPTGANCLGIHVEGPQISFTYKGAHNPYFIQKPDVEQFKRYQQAANGMIKMICIAPEMDDNHALIKYCNENNVKVGIGHTSASYDECISAINDGATSFIHTYNAMSPLNHRQPNTVGAALTIDEAYAEIICDSVHVHPAAVKILARSKGKDKTIIVTDSVSIKGLKPGIYNFETRTVEIMENGCGRLADGTLAGSSNCVNQLVKNAIENIGLDETLVFNAATINPCRRMGFNTKGLIEEGYDADIVVLNDDYSVEGVWINGAKY